MTCLSERVTGLPAALLWTLVFYVLLGQRRTVKNIAEKRCRADRL